MTRFRCLCFGLCVIVFAGTFVVMARRLSAGPERITITCNGRTAQSGPVVIPITVSMASDGPDYVDMTYTATSNGSPVSCSPSSNRFYVSKGNPVTDNVTVTCTAGDTIGFSALGTGETGGDTGGCQCDVTCSGRPPKPIKPASTTPSQSGVTFGTDTKYWVCVVPLEIVLPPPAMPPALRDRVEMTYSATDGNGNPCTCVPASEIVSLDSRVTPPGNAPQVKGLVMRHVAVRSKLVQIPPLTLTVGARGLGYGSTTAENTGTWNLPINQAMSTLAPEQQNVGAVANTGNLLVGYNPPIGDIQHPNQTPVQKPMIQFVEHTVQVIPALILDDALTMKFLAEDSNSQALDCQPHTKSVQFSSTTAPGPFYVMIKCKGASDHGTFTVHAHSLLNPIAFRDFDTPYVFTKQ